MRRGGRSTRLNPQFVTYQGPDEGFQWEHCAEPPKKSLPRGHQHRRARGKGWVATSQVNLLFSIDGGEVGGQQPFVTKWATVCGGTDEN